MYVPFSKANDLTQAGAAPLNSPSGSEPPLCDQEGARIAGPAGHREPAKDPLAKTRIKQPPSLPHHRGGHRGPECAGFGSPCTWAPTVSCCATGLCADTSSAHRIGWRAQTRRSSLGTSASCCRMTPCASMNTRLNAKAVFFIQKQGRSSRGNTNSIAVSSVPVPRPDKPRRRIAAVAAISACTVNFPTVSNCRSEASAAPALAIPAAARTSRHAATQAFGVAND